MSYPGRMTALRSVAHRRTARWIDVMDQGIATVRSALAFISVILVGIAPAAWAQNAQPTQQRPPVWSLPPGDPEPEPEPDIQGPRAPGLPASRPARQRAPQPAEQNPLAPVVTDPPTRPPATDAPVRTQPPPTREAAPRLQDSAPQPEAPAQRPIQPEIGVLPPQFVGAPGWSRTSVLPAFQQVLTGQSTADEAVDQMIIDLEAEIG